MRSLRSFRVIKFALCMAFMAVLGVRAQQPSNAEKHGIDTANMDRSVKPGDDFYEFCNGGWVKRIEIQPTAGV